MTRKDYIAVAAFMRDLKPTHGANYNAERWREFVDYFVARFRQTNPRFNADKFRKACERGDAEAAMRQEIINYHRGDNDE
jgi:hypothetical protein